MIEPAALFLNHKERFIAFAVLAAIFLGSLGWEYQHYKELLSKKRYYTTAEVLNQYKKGKKWVLKLRSSQGFLFYTTSYEDLKDLRARRVRVVLFPKRMEFLDFLSRFYSPAYIISVESMGLRYRLYRWIRSQHEDEKIGELFAALFLATPLALEMRQRIAAFGISHLVAISGFHLGLIAGIAIFSFTFLLRPLFQRLFPYANLLFFATLFSLGIAFAYLLFLGLVPSLVRSFAMMAAGFWLLHRHIRLLSFETLMWVVFLLLALFPRFLFSLAFWLSVSGVFFIYLFLHHFDGWKKWQLAVGINFFVFWMMLPLSLHIFGSFDPRMLFSPFLSLLFIVFYPLELVLHLIGYGGALDGLLGFLDIDPGGMDVEVPMALLGLYLLLLLLALRYRLALYGAAAVTGIVLVYNLA